VIFGILLVLLSATSAHAQHGRERDEERRALTLFEESAAAYHEGRFADAAALLEQAYALHPESVLLYNLARARDAAGDMDRAREAYRQFVDSAPTAEQAGLARGRIDVLTTQIAERDARLETERAAQAAASVSPTPTPPEAAPPEPAASHGPHLLAPGLAIGAAAAIDVVGAILLGVAFSQHEAAVAAPSQLDAIRIEHDAETLRDAGVGVLIGGAVLTTAAAIWLIVAAGSPGSSTPSASLRIGPQSIVVSGSF